MVHLAKIMKLAIPYHLICIIDQSQVQQYENIHKASSALEVLGIHLVGEPETVWLLDSIKPFALFVNTAQKYHHKDHKLEDNTETLTPNPDIIGRFN